MKVPPIVESGMSFDSFDTDRFLYWEKSALRKSFGAGFKAVEFIFIDEDKPNCFKLLEAKTSVPNPKSAKGSEPFEDYIKEIYCKFADTTELFASSMLGFKADREQELPTSFSASGMTQPEIRYILVVKSAKPEWLRPVSESLRREMRNKLRIWNASIIAISAEHAVKDGYISQTRGDE
ncbi:hypothetical protein FACS1894167_09000 [Synergistales bacterium]|nr:hypothetical protein FACS1894167_09000 [Synergistales bacterium]